MSLPDSRPTAEELKEQRRKAEETSDALETALRVARLPVPRGLSPHYGYISQGFGSWLHLGRMTDADAAKWIDALHRHARLHGYVMDAEARSLTSRVLQEFQPPMLSGDGAHLIRKELGQ